MMTIGENVELRIASWLQQIPRVRCFSIGPNNYVADRQRVHRLLVTSAVSEITDGPSLSWKLKNFYDSCMDLDNIRNEGNRILMKDIESFG